MARAKPVIVASKDNTVGREEFWPIARVKPDPKNPRRHPKAQIAQLVALFKLVGQVWPILVKPSGMIIAGHGRLEAAKQLGFKQMKVIVARNWTPAQIEAFGIADNKVALGAGWDKELLQGKLVELRDLGLDLAITAFSKSELGKLDVLLLDGAPSTSPQLGGELSYSIVVRCKSEAHQGKLLAQFEKQGLKCEALIS